MTRLERLERALEERHLDALIVTDVVNVRWLTGFTGSNAAAVVGPGLRRFVTDFRYLTQSAEQVPEEFEREIATELLPVVARDLPARVGFDDLKLAVKSLERLRDAAGDDVELIGAGGVVEDLRAIKDEAEIAKMRAAAQLADAALKTVLERGLAGRTERAVGLDLEFELRRLGAEAISFPPIIAAGEHGALPHAVPRDVDIPRGTFVVVDWGAQLDGYCSDCTRTFATGEVDPRHAEVYEVVLAAQLASLDAVRPGPTGREVDAMAREIIAAAGHGEHFGHGLGHGVGLEVHEGPRLSASSDTLLAAGQVVTVEPGVYVPGVIGVRIEDLVVVTADGHDVLSSLPKDLTVV